MKRFIQWALSLLPEPEPCQVMVPPPMNRHERRMREAIARRNTR